jgi:hypothetical protein
MRILIAILFSSMLNLAQAAEVAGVTFAERIDGPTGAKLVLNGAGLRTRVFFKVYAMGLYLGARKGSADAVLALAGPKRITIHMLRDVDADTFSEALVDGLRANHGEAQMQALAPQVAQLVAIMAEIKEAKEGMAIALDEVPGKSVVVRINGAPAGKPIAGEGFYRALLRIWLGPSPVQDDLKAALLGAKP